jgi:TRAP-type C4-dicarboxylate transport system permease small subunit
MVALMSGMVVLIFAQVIYRYILLQPLSWSEELAKYFFSGITLFGSAILFREAKHISMSLLRNFFKSVAVKRGLDIAAGLLSALFLVVVIVYAFPMALQILDFEVISPSMEWLKMGYIFLMLPVSAVLSLPMILESVIDAWSKMDESERNEA